MKRRDFIALTGAAIISSRMAWAQQPPAPKLKVGMVHPVSPKGVPPNYIAFAGRLKELGYVEGDNLMIEYINLEGHTERYDAAMRELVDRRVDVIFALGQEDNLRAAMAATKTIPIVMVAIGYDPMAKGYIASLARPTGNVTGIYLLTVEAIKKRLQLFKDAFPQMRAAFGFWDFDGTDIWQAAVVAAPSLGLSLRGVELRNAPYDYERGLEQVAPEFRGAMFLPASAVFTRDAQRLAAFALKHRMVSFFDSAPIYVDAGGLMSYGADILEAGRRAAEFADRLARGASPSDLPVEQSTRFALRINLKTAKVLGVTFPATVLASADDVIE